MLYLGHITFNSMYIQYANTYFFTATALNWNIIFDEEAKKIIANSLKYLVEKNRIILLGFVVMPNHIHVICRINEDFLIEDVQRDFMKYTAQQIKFHLQAVDPEKLEQHLVNAKDWKYQIWKRKSLSIPIDNNLIFEQKLNYIHENPLQAKWHLVDKPEDYFYSSARFYATGIDHLNMLTNGFE